MIKWWAVWGDAAAGQYTETLFVLFMGTGGASEAIVG